MSKILFICFFLLIVGTSFAQSFEGTITYKNTYKSKIPDMTSQEFAGMMGDTQKYSIKEGDYKSVSNGSVFQWQLYLNNENKVYSKMSNSDTILWNDAFVNQDQVIKAEINKNAIEILGYKCDELILTCKTGTYKYYFNSKFAIDSKLYDKHKYGNWYEFVSRTRALPLMLIVDNAQVTFESVAIGVKPMQLNKSIFVLSPDIKTMKAPY